MSTTPSSTPGAPSNPETKSDDRGLFEDIVVRDGSKVILHLDRLGQDADHALEVGEVLAKQMADKLTGRVKGMWDGINRGIKDAHQEVKDRRGPTPPDASNNPPSPVNDIPPTD